MTINDRLSPNRSKEMKAETLKATTESNQETTSISPNFIVTDLVAQNSKQLLFSYIYEYLYKCGSKETLKSLIREDKAKNMECLPVIKIHDLSNEQRSRLKMKDSDFPLAKPDAVLDYDSDDILDHIQIKMITYAPESFLNEWWLLLWDLVSDTNKNVARNSKDNYEFQNQHHKTNDKSINSRKSQGHGSVETSPKTDDDEYNDKPIELSPGSKIEAPILPSSKASIKDKIDFATSKKDKPRLSLESIREVSPRQSLAKTISSAPIEEGVELSSSDLKLEKAALKKNSSLESRSAQRRSVLSDAGPNSFDRKSSTAPNYSLSLNQRQILPSRQHATIQTNQSNVLAHQQIMMSRNEFSSDVNQDKPPMNTAELQMQLGMRTNNTRNHHPTLQNFSGVPSMQHHHSYPPSGNPREMVSTPEGAIHYNPEKSRSGSHPTTIPQNYFQHPHQQQHQQPQQHPFLQPQHLNPQPRPQYYPPHYNEYQQQHQPQQPQDHQYDQQLSISQLKDQLEHQLRLLHQVESQQIYQQQQPRHFQHIAGFNSPHPPNTEQHRHPSKSPSKSGQEKPYPFPPEF